MTTEAEAREIWDAIQTFQNIDQQNAQLQAKAESDQRRAAALDYIATLDLKLKGKNVTEKKVECYDLMELLKSQMNGKDGETRQELQKKIDELLIQANQFKDLQRAGKIV